MARSAARLKVAAVPHAVPQSAEAVTAAIAEIGRRQRERELIQAAMNEELAQLRERYEAEARPHTEAIAALIHGVHLWCETHRAGLTQEGKVKHHRFASGEVKWRLRPPSVTVRAAEVVIETLKELGLTRFVRVREEVNKEAVLADWEAVGHIKGISISQREDFVVLPWETELEELA
jgi:phage host-nuclease inhibitor protein Gam